MIVRVRDGWVTIGGTRNGLYLIYWGSEPQLGYATDPETVPGEPLFLLGVAHTDCFAKARSRLENGSITLPRDLPDLQVEAGDSVPRLPYKLHMPVVAGVCPFCDSRARLTREHVWPEWYSRELRARGVVLAGDPIVSNNKINITVPVCAECNNTWMSVLEKDAKDLNDLIRCLDYDQKTEGGASALVRMVRSFAAAGIVNRVVAIFDNDTAAAHPKPSLIHRRIEA